MATSGTVEQSAQNRKVSETVVSAVAELTGSDPVSLEPLYGVVDPDSLDTLFRANGADSQRPPNRVAFSYCDCDVVVLGDGTVSVSQAESERSTHKITRRV